MRFKDQLNKFYKDLDDQSNRIKDILTENGFTVKSGYFNGHFNKDASGSYVKDYYPIPVIEVKGLCDIEIVGDSVNVTTKTSKENAIKLDYEKLSRYKFETYGVIDYLTDYYKSGEDIANLYKSLEACNEREIGFGFSFANSTATNVILNLLILLKNNGFYY